MKLKWREELEVEGSFSGVRFPTGRVCDACMMISLTQAKDATDGRPRFGHFDPPLLYTTVNAR